MIYLYIISFLMIAAVVYLLIAYRKLKNTQIEASKNVVNLTTSNFSVTIMDKVALVDFWAEWCVPCKVMSPILNEISEEVNDFALIAKVNVETDQPIAARFGIRNIPTMILFKNGIEVKRFIGIQSKSLLIKEINKLK